MRIPLVEAAAWIGSLPVERRQVQGFGSVCEASTRLVSKVWVSVVRFGMVACRQLAVEAYRVCCHSVQVEVEPSADDGVVAQTTGSLTEWE